MYGRGYGESAGLLGKPALVNTARSPTVLQVWQGRAHSGSLPTERQSKSAHVTVGSSWWQGFNATQCRSSLGQVRASVQSGRVAGNWRESGAWEEWRAV